MKRVRVAVSDDVKAQIVEQVSYIAADSVANALAWERRLLIALNSLSDFHGHAVDEHASLRLGEAVRKMVFEKTYLIHYRIDAGAFLVQIINFRHGARLPRADEP